jgi:hypothetical protein
VKWPEFLAALTPRELADPRPAAVRAWIEAGEEEAGTPEA